MGFIEDGLRTPQACSQTGVLTRRPGTRRICATPGVISDPAPAFYRNYNSHGMAPTGENPDVLGLMGFYRHLLRPDAPMVIDGPPGGWPQCSWRKPFPQTGLVFSHRAFMEGQQQLPMGNSIGESTPAPIHSHGCTGRMRNGRCTDTAAARHCAGSGFFPQHISRKPSAGYSLWRLWPCLHCI